MKTSNKLLVGLLGVIMTVILSFLIAARMNAEVASPEQRAKKQLGDVQGNGQLGVDLRSLPAFHAVALHSNMDVEISASFEQVEVEAEDNLFGNIITAVDKETLHIHWKEGEWANSTLPIKIRIPLDSLTALSLNDRGFITVLDTIISDTLTINSYGGGDMFFHTKTDHIRVNIHGNGNVEAAGTANHLDLKVYGSGDLSALALDLQTAFIHTEGNGGARVSVTEELKGNTHGRGHVKLRGTANTTEFKARNGRLIHLDE